MRNAFLFRSKSVGLRFLTNSPLTFRLGLYYEMDVVPVSDRLAMYLDDQKTVMIKFDPFRIFPLGKIMPNRQEMFARYGIEEEWLISEIRESLGVVALLQGGIR